MASGNASVAGGTVAVTAAIGRLKAGKVNIVGSFLSHKQGSMRTMSNDGAKGGADKKPLFPGVALAIPPTAGCAGCVFCSAADTR
jgi:hypothetical protein